MSNNRYLPEPKRKPDSSLEPKRTTPAAPERQKAEPPRARIGLNKVVPWEKADPTKPLSDLERELQGAPERTIGKRVADRARDKLRPSLLKGRTGLFPTPGRLRAAGRGSIVRGIIEMGAMKNPIYRAIISRLPFEGHARTAIGAGCGCVSGCGCATNCCSCMGCLWPLLAGLVLYILFAFMLGGSTRFAQPLFCQANQLAACAEGVSISVGIDEIPAGALERYKQVEAETGVPWFYLVAWEKVATDFGRLDGLPGSDSFVVPADALSATRAATEELAELVDANDGHDLIAPPDPDATPSPANPGATPPPDPTDNDSDEDAEHDLLDQAREEKELAIRRLRSSLRGGSFGLLLISLEEWDRWGTADPETDENGEPVGDGGFRDAWNRADAGMMLAQHMADVFGHVAEARTLTSYATDIVQPLAPDMESFIGEQLSRSNPAYEEDLEWFSSLVEVEVEATPPPAGTSLITPVGEHTVKAPYGPSTNEADPAMTVGGTAHEHFHAFVTYETPPGGKVVAAADGSVREINELPSDGDETLPRYELIIEHPAGITTIYRGLGADLPFAEGDEVVAGDRIGAVERGPDGVLLDFGVRDASGDPLDPASRISTEPSGSGHDATEVTWPDGPRTSLPVTDAERFHICVTLNGPLAGAGRCDPFRTGDPTITVDPTQSFADAISAYYDPSLPEAEQVTDWQGLQVLMGAVMDHESMWGSETDAYYEAPRITPEGRKSNETVKVNAYVQAINMYAKTLFESWVLAGQLEADSGPIGGLRDYAGMDMRFWRPAIDAASETLSIDWQYLAGTLQADGAFACRETDESDVLLDPDTGEPMTIEAAEAAGMTEGADFFAGRNGLAISTVTPTPVERCYRFGTGTASHWGHVVTTDGHTYDDEPAAAMNFCEWGFRRAGGDLGNCGTAVITSIDTGQTAEIPIVEYCNCWTGAVSAEESPSIHGEHERMVDLNTAALEMLGLEPGSLYDVRVTIRPPADPVGWPLFIQRGQVDELDTPANVVRTIAGELRRELTGLSPSAKPNLLQMYEAWAGYSSCSIDPGAAAVVVTDPTDPEKSLGQIVPCEYSQSAATYSLLYFSTGGGTQTTRFGRQAVSATGYIAPVVGYPMTDGFTPRSGGFAYLAFYDPQSRRFVGSAHDGLDIGAPCNTIAVADKDGWASGGRGYAQIRHDDGLVSVYGHMFGLVPELEARKGTNGQVYVKRGEPFGIVGNVGAPCHLHYAIYLNGTNMGPASAPTGSDVRTPGFWGGKAVIERANPSGDSGHWLVFRIDPLHVMPQDPKIFASRGTYNGHTLYLYSAADPDWYYTKYPDSNGFPPPLDAEAFRRGIIRLTNGVTLGD